MTARTGIFCTDRVIEEVSPAMWFGNVFERNVFSHGSPGAPGVFLYDHGSGNASWSLEELESLFPESFSGNREIEVEFTDAANGDFSLPPGSPLIDSGIDVGLPYRGKAPDIGAVEAEEM